jgi:hypothetical protein
MRHDKEAFAQAAIKSAHVGKLIGDYIRILYFSEYARVINPHFKRIKEKVDPFTGCFISRIPISVVYLRFALKAAAMFSERKDKMATDFSESGRKRIGTALRFTRGNPSQLGQKFNTEKQGWDLYYDSLAALENALQRNEPYAAELRQKALDLIDRMRI